MFTIRMESIVHQQIKQKHIQ